MLQSKPSLKNSKPVSSYELKTSFYWLCERKNTWENVAVDVKEILENLLQFLQRRTMPDYFIKEKNIIENVTCDMIDKLSEKLQKSFTRSGFADFLRKCFWYCYNTELESYDSLYGTSMKCLYSEIEHFCQVMSPSLKLSMFTIIYLLLDLFLVAIDATNSSNMVVDTKPILLDIRKIHGGLIKRMSLQSEIINVNELEELFTFYGSFSFEYLSDFTDLLFEVLSQEVVLDTLEESVWCMVARLIGQHCIAAGLYHGVKQEVKDFAELLDANPDNTRLQEMVTQTHGSMEEFQAYVERANENADEVYEFYERICQESLLFYFGVCERFSVGEEFYCEDEKIAVFGVQSIIRNIPEIMDDEMLGTAEFRQRLQSLVDNIGHFKAKEF